MKRVPFSGIAAGLLLLIACSSESDPPATAGPVAAGTSQLNVDNIFSHSIEVVVDGKSRGSVGPFEIGVYELPAGSHEVVVSGPKGEIDRATAKISKGKTIVFNPLGRGSYFIENLTYASRPTVTFTTVGIQGREVRGQKLVEADFGLTAKVPDTISMDKDGKTLKTKVHRLAPDKLTAPEALSYLKAPRDGFVGDATPAAFNALLAAKDIQGLAACLERDGRLALDFCFQKIWEAGLDLPEGKLAQWVVAAPPAGRDARSSHERAMYAALMLAERGSLEAACRLPRERVADLKNVRFEELLRALPPARAQALYRGMLSLCPERAWHALWFGWIKPDEESSRRIDAYIQGLKPGRPDEPYGRERWLEAQNRAYETSGGIVPLEKQLTFLDAAAPGTQQSQQAIKVLQTGRFKELAAALPGLRPQSRRSLFHAFNEVRARARKPATPDEVAFLNAGLAEKDDLIRMLLISGVISSLHRDRDPLLIEWARAAVDKEPHAQNQKNLKSSLNAILGK